MANVNPDDPLECLSCSPAEGAAEAGATSVVVKGFKLLRNPDGKWQKGRIRTLGELVIDGEDDPKRNDFPEVTQKVNVPVDFAKRPQYPDRFTVGTVPAGSEAMLWLYVIDLDGETSVARTEWQTFVGSRKDSAESAAEIIHGMREKLSAFLKENASRLVGKKGDAFRDELTKIGKEFVADFGEKPTDAEGDQIDEKDLVSRTLEKLFQLVQFMPAGSRQTALAAIDGVRALRNTNNNDVFLQHGLRISAAEGKTPAAGDELDAIRPFVGAMTVGVDGWIEVELEFRAG
jgi:hypothetical protein